MLLLHDERNEVFGLNENHIVWFYANKKYPRPETEYHLARTAETNTTIKAAGELEFDVSETVEQIAYMVNNCQTA